MRATNWTATTSDRAVALRAGGRRRYNAERQAARERRRCAIAALLARDLWGVWTGPALAARLGVSRATVCRDLAAIVRQD